MKIFTLSLAAMAVLSAAAQTTGSLDSRDHSVYCPSENGNVMNVSYDNLINASNASATITIGSTTTTLQIENVSEWGFSLPVGAALQGKANNTQFTINVKNVVPADTINTSVENVSGVYLYRQTLPTVTANPANDSEIDVTKAVTFTFSEAVNVDQIIYTSGSFMNRLINYDNGVAGYATVVTANVKEEYWSKSTTPANMNIRLNNVTLNGGWYLPDYTFDYTHTFPAETAQYETYSPLNSEMTVWNVYGEGWGLVDFIFSGEVTVANGAEVTYYTTDGEEIVNRVSSDQIWGDWGFWDSKYHVEVPLPEDKSLDENILESISVTLLGVTSNGVSISVPTVVYDNMSLPEIEYMIKSNTAGMNLIQNAETVTVYDSKGMLVNRNMSVDAIGSLNKGLYIINGKKVIIK